jgi:sulfur carrier protein
VAEPLPVLVNGTARDLPAGATVADAVGAVTDSVRGVAVAVNGEVVPRGAWGGTALTAGDRVEVLTAAQGG